MNIIRIRICGITRPGGVLTTVEAGADAIGPVFYTKSRNTVAAAQAKGTAMVLPPFVPAVAPFVNEQPDVIREILHQVSIDVIQSHGDEDDNFCRQLDRPYLKTVHVQSAANIQTACARSPNARTLLFGTYHPTRHGGTRQSFDWMILSEDLDKPQILAGELTPGNVVDAVRTNGTATVDVSGGVEGSAGIKDKEKMTASVVTAKVI